MKRVFRVSLKILLVCIVIAAYALFLRGLGFQLLNGMVAVSSAPPPNLDENLGKAVLLMIFVSLFALKNWIKK